MSDSISTTDSLINCSVVYEEALTSCQLSTSMMLQSFSDQALDGYTLCGMMGASLIASFAKVHSSQLLSLFIKDPKKNYFIKGGSFLASCFAEAAGVQSIPKILKGDEVLGGRIQEGLGGYFHTTFMMILMKGSGFVLPPNLLIQHIIQDVLMVELDKRSAQLGLIDPQTGEWIEQIANAEVMSCQSMMTGAVISVCFEGVRKIEAAQELKYQMKQGSSFQWKEFLSNISGKSPQAAEFAVEGGGKIFTQFSFEDRKQHPLRSKDRLFSAMMMSGNSVNQEFLPKTGEKTSAYTERLVAVSKKGDLGVREKSGLEITLALHQILLSSRRRFNEVIQELLRQTQSMQEGDGILVYKYRVPEVGVELTLLNTVSTFLPEHWSSVAREAVFSYLNRLSEPISLAVELGSGGGVLSITARKTGKINKIIGIDINPYTTPVATLNAAMNGVGNIRFHAADLANLTQTLQGKKADLIFGCIPQLIRQLSLGPVHPEELEKIAKEISHRDRADYSPPRGMIEDAFGLSDNAMAIKQARACLNPHAPLILMLSERAGDQNLAALFSEREMHPTVLHERVIPQAAGMDLRPLVEAESHLGNHRFRFRLPDGRFVSATEAMAIPLADLSHQLHAVIGYSYEHFAAQAVNAVKKTANRWGYTKDPITEDPRLLKAARSFLSHQLKLEISEQVVAIGPNSEAMLEAVLKLSVVSGRKIGVVGAIEAGVLEKIRSIDHFRFCTLPTDFQELTAAIQREPIEAVILKPSRQILKDSAEIEIFLREAEARKTLVVLLEDHPSRANDPSYTLLATAAKSPEFLQNLVCIQDLRKFGLPLPLSFALVPDSALYKALMNYADVTYSRVSTATSQVAARFFELLLSTSPLDSTPLTGSVERVENDGRMLSDIAKRFQLSATFKSDPTTFSNPDYPHIIDMSFGESEWRIQEAGQSFITNPSSLDLNKEKKGASEAALNYFNQTRGVTFAPDEIFSGPGVHPLLHATVQGIKKLHRGSVEVLIPFPRYGAYYPTPLTLDGVSVITIPTQSSHHFLLTLHNITTIATAKRGVKRILIDNFPTNPAGQYYEDGRSLIEVAKEVDYFLIDEVFGQVDYRQKGSFVSLPAIVEQERFLRNKFVFFGGLSKEFSLGGLRYGFQITHNRAVLKATQASLMTTEDPFALRAAQYFFPRWKTIIPQHLEYLKPKARALTQFFCRRGFGVHQPQGGYTVFVNFERLFEKSNYIHGEQLTSDNFHELLMKYAAIKIKSDQWAGVKGHYRFVFSIDNLSEAIERLEKFFDQIH